MAPHSAPKRDTRDGLTGKKKQRPGTRPHRTGTASNGAAETAMPANMTVDDFLDGGFATITREENPPHARRSHINSKDDPAEEGPPARQRRKAQRRHEDVLDEDDFRAYLLGGALSGGGPSPPASDDDGEPPSAKPTRGESSARDAERAQRSDEPTSSATTSSADDTSSESSGGASGDAGAALQQSPSVVDFEDPFLKRRRASAAARGAEGSGVDRSAAREAGDGGVVSRGEFQAMQREVERLGAKGLDKKALAEFKARELERIGAKADKGPRIPLSIGKGLAKKRKQREDAARDLAFETGMAQRKGSGKAKRRERARSVDKGLGELGGFSAGMLRVSGDGAGRRRRGGGAAGGGVRRGGGGVRRGAPGRPKFKIPKF
ncbi:unnamed protein product [Pedinophyceae sp. YPF-701]|nr:unnamed protein product [Pedinophyceae sp. YPF-701]